MKSGDFKDTTPKKYKYGTPSPTCRFPLKRRYTQFEAIRLTRGATDTMRPYKCSGGRHWHIGHPIGTKEVLDPKSNSSKVIGGEDE